MTRRHTAGELAAHLQTGRQAEDQAKSFLEARGLRCLERNFRTRTGEIDLVMDDHGTLVFVEVRYRRTRRFGGALESVDHKKRGRLLATAQWYINAHGSRAPARFDVLAVEPDDDGGSRFTWVKDAIRDN